MLHISGIIEMVVVHSTSSLTSKKKNNVTFRALMSPKKKLEYVPPGSKNVLCSLFSSNGANERLVTF